MRRLSHVAIQVSSESCRAQTLREDKLTYTMALDLSIVRRAVTVRLESILGVDFDGDMTVGEKVEWIDECVELLSKLS